jgi:hypothetical protein
MPTASGIAAQLGYAAETTWGSYKVPDHWVEVVSESFALNVQRIEGKGMRASNRVQRSDRWVSNKKGVTGSVQFEVASKGFGLWIKHCLGAVTTTTPGGGTNSKTHTGKVGDPFGLGLTVQVGRPDNAGVVQPFSYMGCKITDWEIANTVDNFVTLSSTLDGQDESTVTGLASASYASADELLSFVGGALTIAGSQVATVHDISIKGTNALKTDRYGIRTSTLKKEPIQNGLIAISGSLTSEFESLTAYNRYVNGTQASVVATWTGATLLEGSIFPSLVCTMPVCRFDGTTPNLSGQDMLTQTLPFVALYDGSQEPISVAYTTLDTTP